MKLNDNGQPTLTLDLLRLIMIEELGIDEDRVAIYNQKFNLDNKSSLYIYIEPKTPPRMISSRNRMVNDLVDGPVEHQDSNWLEEIAIGMYSRNLDALQRNQEAAMALHSMYSQQVQEANSFKIFRNVGIVPIDAEDGAARLYRFDIECRVQAWYSKIKVAQWLASNQIEVRVNDGIPDLDVKFVIPSQDPTVYPQI